ncbi:MAG: hypothetical protein AABX02_01190 [archaeon]
MNTRGQAFSTFQLLIAAVVALAILVLLLNIIGSLPNLGGQKPNKVASDLVASQVNSPAELRTSTNVPFGKDDSLNAKSIASTSGVITEGQICLSLGDHAEASGETGFHLQGVNNNIITYDGSSSLRVKISVLCDTGGQIQTDLEDNGDYGGWTNDCTDLPPNQTACIVALRFA